MTRKTAQKNARASAKRKRRTRKPEFFEAGGLGVKLTEAQANQWRAECQRLFSERPGDSLEASRVNALSNVIYRSRPSVRAADRFRSRDLFDRASAAMLTLGGFRDLNLGTRDVEMVALYNAVIGRVASEFRAIGEELTTIHGAIERETVNMRTRGAP